MRLPIAAVAEWVALAAIAAGVLILWGVGIALIVGGALVLLNLTADVWLPALSRHGRRHGTDTRSRNS